MCEVKPENVNHIDFRLVNKLNKLGLAKRIILIRYYNNLYSENNY